METVKIKDWDTWQSHRKDRSPPPWIKLHRILLSNFKWAMLSDAEKGQIISIWLVAADNNGEIPSNSTVIKKICHLDEELDLLKFSSLGFFEGAYDADTTPTRRQHAAPE